MSAITGANGPKTGVKIGTKALLIPPKNPTAFMPKFFTTPPNFDKPLMAPLTIPAPTFATPLIHEPTVLKQPPTNEHKPLQKPIVLPPI